MKKTILILIVLIIGMLSACSNENNTSGNQNSDRSQSNSNIESEVTDSHEILFDFTIRQNLGGVDASIYQMHFLVDVTWDGLDFEAASVFNREVQHRSGRYDVQEDVIINGKLSSDEKNIESLSFRNERTGEIYEMLKFEFENIPFTDDNLYSDSSFKFYIREGVGSLAEYIKLWDEQSRKDGEITDITSKFETLEKFGQEVELTVSFYFK